MKKTKDLISRALCQFDVFSVYPTMRHNQEAFSSTYGLGFISLLLYAFFLWLFAKNLMEITMMDSSQIETSQTLQKNSENRNLENFMFGIQFPPQFIVPESQRPSLLSEFNLTELQRYMEIFVYIGDSNDPLVLKRCQPKDWKLLGDNYQSYFKQNELFNSYCPQQAINMTGVDVFKNFMQLSIYYCDNGTTNQCVDLEAQKKYYADVIQSYGHFPIWIDFLVNLPQLGEPNPLKYVIQTKRYSATQTINEQSFTEFNTFVISTDSSIWPVIEVEPDVKNGIQISENSQSFSLIADGLIFTFIGFFGRKVYNYDRSLTKIDDVLSYVGGLLGIILIFLSFFFETYNKIRYQLRVGQNSFNYYSNGEMMKQKMLNPWLYIKYTIWSWVELLTTIPLQWQICVELDETFDQINFMMDVEKLFRRLQFIQRCLIKKININLLCALSLLECESIKDIQRKRKVLDYYQEIIRLQECPSVLDIINLSKQEQIESNRAIEMIMHMNMEQKHIQQRNSGAEIKSDSSSEKQTKKQIAESLKNDLQLHHEPEICDQVSKLVGLANQARQLKIRQQFNQIEQLMTNSFLALKPERKTQIIMNMPVLILHRLRLRAKNMRNDLINEKIEEKKKQEKNLIKSLFLGLSGHQPNQPKL